MTRLAVQVALPARLLALQEYTPTSEGRALVMVRLHSPVWGLKAVWCLGVSTRSCLSFSHEISGVGTPVLTATNLQLSPGLQMQGCMGWLNFGGWPLVLLTTLCGFMVGHIIIKSNFTTSSTTAHLFDDGGVYGNGMMIDRGLCRPHCQHTFSHCLA